MLFSWYMFMTNLDIRLHETYINIMEVPSLPFRAGTSEEYTLPEVFGRANLDEERTQATPNDAERTGRSSWYHAQE